VLVNALSETREIKGIDNSNIFEIGTLKYAVEPAQTDDSSSASASSSTSGSSSTSASSSASNSGPSIIREQPNAELRYDLENKYISPMPKSVPIPGLSVKSLKITAEEDLYQISTEIENTGQENVSELMVALVIKDIDGQVQDVLESKKFSIEANSMHSETIGWNIGNDAGIYLITSNLYKSNELAGVSKELQVIFDRPMLQEKYILSESPFSLR
jgi:hypothetical protein